MFTGLVEDTGAVLRVQPGEGGRALAIRPGRLDARELAVGDSIAIDGVCLTVTGHEGDAFTVTAVSETLRRTTLGALAPGAAVNLERALRAGDRLGGHMVQGHVDGVGQVTERRGAGEDLELHVRAPAGLGRYIIEQGSIALSGVSLTGARRPAADSCAAALIPHTAAVTTLGALQAGGRVNLEVDMIAKYVERLLGPRAAPGGETP